MAKLARAGAVGSYPLAVLFGLNLVDELDRVAFSVLAPEIRDAVGASDAALVAVASMATSLSIILALPIGYLGDRVSRVRISVAAAFAWSIGCVLTASARGLSVVGLGRFVGGAGRLVGDSVHPSLLSDYYAPPKLADVTAVHRSGSSLGALIGAPVAGFLAVNIGWRATFLLLLVPTGILIALAARLRDPRSQTAQHSTPRVRESFQKLWQVRSLRRIWVVAFLYGGSFVPLLSVMLGLYLERVASLDVGARGLVLGLHGVAAILGLFVGGRLAARRLAAGEHDAATRLVGFFIVGFGVGLAAMAVAPSAAVAVALTIAIAPGTTGYLPPYTALVAVVTPSGVRSQAYAYALFAFAVGGLAFSNITAAILDNYGIRGALGLLSVLGVFAGFTALSAVKFVAQDVARANVEAGAPA